MTDSNGDASKGWYSNDAATFGDRVAAAREARGLSQADLARKLGVKLRTVQGWEDDLSEPRANKLQLLSGVLNVSLVWLLNGEGEGVAAPGEGAEIPPEVGGLLSEIREIRGQMAHLAERLARTEKQLRRALQDTAL